jgi:molybdopterin synthase catalytic subunit
MRVIVQQAPFDPREALTLLERELVPGSYGAQVSFIGTLRDFNEGAQVRSMELEYYPGMTERAISQICATAGQRWRVTEGLVMHRVGTLHPGEPIVLVAVWSAHRSDAFDACRYIINELKERAPFWKRELRPDGARWVETNTADTQK